MSYYEQHKEKIKAQAIKWQKENKEKHLAQQRVIQKRLRKKYPLIKRLRNIKQRCTCPSDPAYKYYGTKGVECLLTAADLEFLWNRDLAFLLLRPSIHRIDSDGNYTVNNCKFMELTTHMKLHARKKT